MRSCKLAAAMVSALVATAATQARAGVEIDYSLDGGANFTTLATANSGATAGALGAFTVGGLTINTMAMSNSPGTPSIAKLLSASLDIVNNTGTTQSVILKFGDVGFLAPGAAAAVQLDSHIGGSVTAVGGGSANAISFTSYVDNTGLDRQNYTGAGTVASGTGTPNITAAGSTFKDDEYGTIATINPPFSITQVLSLTLGAGGEINFSDNTSLTPIPEPLSLGLLGVGLAGLAAVRRRRA